MVIKSFLTLGTYAMNIRSVLLVAAVMSLSACDQDPFRIRQRPVLAGYELEQWEDSRTFYLVKSGDTDDGGGVLEGTVQRIGWDSRYIVADRKANFGGDDDGWMIIDTATGAVTGPFSNAEFESRPQARSVRVWSASEAWKRLR